MICLEIFITRLKLFFYKINFYQTVSVLIIFWKYGRKIMIDIPETVTEKENALRKLLVTDTLERKQEDEIDVDSQEEAQVAADLSNIYKPDDYDSSGCPIVPMAFSGMTGRLGNVMCTYSNFIALKWKLGFKYFLPQYMNHHTEKDITKP